MTVSGAPFVMTPGELMMPELSAGNCSIQVICP